MTLDTSQNLDGLNISIAWDKEEPSVSSVLVHHANNCTYTMTKVQTTQTLLQIQRQITNNCMYK